jgi:hypothetical protein
MRGNQAEASVTAFDATVVRLAGVVPASEATAAVGRRRYLHAGPPVALDELPGPMRAALAGAMVFEGEARDLAEADRILAAGDVELSPCQDAGGVGAMAGIVTPNMPVVLAEAEDGATAFSPVNEGLGRALRFGSNDEATLQRLRRLRDDVAPLIDRAVRATAIDLTNLMAEGLRRGDECHNRNVASSAALLLQMTPRMIRLARPDEDPAGVLEQLSANPHFFLPFSMAACKALADGGHGIARSPVVTAMAANGIRFGIQVSGLGTTWFTAPAPVGEPKLFPGYSIGDAQPAMGDSFITETVGLGAFALSAAPAIAAFVGGDPREASARVDEMRRICAGTSSRFLLPFDGFRGTPVGIDVGLVAATGVAPLANNGLAHREPGRGQVGAGLTRLPLEPFIWAARALRASSPLAGSPS